jgi:hypothetical protein
MVKRIDLSKARPHRQTLQSPPPAKGIADSLAEGQPANGRGKKLTVS